MLKTRPIIFVAALLLFSIYAVEAQAQQLALVSFSEGDNSSQGGAPANTSGSEMRELGPETDKVYAVVQLGLFFGKRVQDQSENMLVSPSLQLSGGYRFRHWLQTGLGTGLERYGRVTINPVFAEVRGTLRDKFFSPYYVVKLGGAFAEVQNDFRYQNAIGGLMAEGQAGLAFRFGHLSWLIGTGYRLQQVKLEGISTGWTGDNYRLQYRDFRRLVTATSFRFTF